MTDCNVHTTLGLGNNHETMIIVPSWSHDSHTVKFFNIVHNIIVNTVIIVKFTVLCHNFSNSIMTTEHQ